MTIAVTGSIATDHLMRFPGRFSEQLLASAVGSSSARLILSLLFRRHDRESRDAFRLLDDATEALQHNRDLLQIALDQMEQGITVFDRDFRLICWNRQYRALFDLPDEMGQVGVSLDRILQHLVRRGDIDGAERLGLLDRLTEFGGSWQIELRTSGRTIELKSNPMPDGGLVATYADISARVEADQALKRVNESLEQRVRSRTAELMEVNHELGQAQKLAEEDVSVEVLDLRTLVPWDRDAVLSSVERCSKVLVLHEDTKTGGFGGEIAATIAEEAFEHLDAPVRRLAAPDSPVPFAPSLEKAFIPQVDDVAGALRELAAY